MASDDSHGALQLGLLSRSGYYNAGESALATPKVCAANVRLKAAFAASGRTDGSRRLCTALQSQGLTIGRHQVHSLVREYFHATR